MRFNTRARIDSGNVREGGGGGSRLPIPGGVAGAGGGVGVVGLLIFVLIQVLGGGDGGVGGGADGSGNSERYADCLTGEDANQNVDCARRAVTASLQDYWATELPEQGGVQFVEAPVTTFTGQVSTACGVATSAVGPFYCPGDQGIYLDTTFFDEVLEGQLGGSGGDFVEPYVLAHEYGHHIQNLLGTMARVRDRSTGADSDAVRLELQADCYAGMWTHAASSTQDESGVAIFAEISDEDIDEALDAAAAVGDDHIQEQTQGQVSPETWTHGSSEQRQDWFRVGYEGGTLSDCDTFAADDL